LTTKIGIIEGICPRCEKTYHQKRPAEKVVCDFYCYCSLCGTEMMPFNPDLNPKT